MLLSKIIAVALFEWKRALTAPRMAWWFLLLLFPSVIVSLIRFGQVDDVPSYGWATFFFALTPMLICMLGSFLSAAPAISTELERKSWSYLAVRPQGSLAVLLGKYLATVSWVLPAALLGLVLAIALAPHDTPSAEEWADIRWTMVRLSLLSCPAYAALYTLLGALFPRRAMVVAVAYTLVFEVVVGIIPAVINQFTVQFRLRALFVDWQDIPISGRRVANVVSLFGASPAWVHVTVLLAYTAALLLVAAAAVRWREYTLHA